MKSSPLAFRQIEWWTITFIFLVIVIINTIGFSGNDNHFWNEHFAKVMIPIILYVGFYLIHMLLIPSYLKRKNVYSLIGFGLLIATCTGVFTTLLASSPFHSVNEFLKFYFNTLALYGAYSIAVLLVRNGLMPPKLRDYQFYNGLRLCLIFIFVTVFLFQAHPVITNEIVIIVFSLFLPLTLVVVFYYYKLIFSNYEVGKKKAARWFLVLLIVGGFFPFFAIGVDQNSEEIILVGVAITAFMLFVLFPISRLIFKKYADYLGQLSSLSHEVTQGSANLSFLKSQINPHFLFNALNTLYGSALTENAEKTSDGIQKLGDMMRFMLHENLQDKISIKREIEYLQNYLDIQLLRFGKEPNLELSIQIQEDFCEGDIAPMMLIPFIENAFKHGISTKNKSWIKINLRCMKGSIHLDVVNSIHPKKATEDPKDESGIGLENVKKRLELLYPSAHSLTIVANDLEHFVHFSLQLR